MISLITGIEFDKLVEILICCAKVAIAPNQIKVIEKMITKFLNLILFFRDGNFDVFIFI
ncbi:hypothetical protein K9M48_01200 [Candidatus Gracilibacteria bacterium]|nr:hypothetical protein [Candidatus Gracilibacteria bacterium]